MSYDFDVNVENFIVDIEDLSDSIIEVDYNNHGNSYVFELKIKENGLIQSGNFAIKIDAEDKIQNLAMKHFKQKVTFNNTKNIFWFYE